MPENPLKRGRGRPRKGAEVRGSLSVSVPRSTIARLRSHAARTGQTVSDVVAAILAAADLGDLPPSESLDVTAFESGGYDPKAPEWQARHISGGYDPETGSY